MPVGQVSEKVEVTATQPLVETDTSQRGQVISGEQIRALPLISREYSSLALLTTGVKLAGSSLTTGNTPREGAFNVNGLRSTVNNFLIDGIDNNAYGTSNQGFSNQVMQPPPDAITRVQGRHQQHERRVRPRGRRDDQRQLPQRHQHGCTAAAGSSSATTSMNATGFFKPTTGKPTLDRHQFGGCSAARSCGIKRSSSAITRGCGRPGRSTGFASIATPAQRQGILAVDVRDPRSGVDVSGRHAGADDRLRARVLAGLPDTNLPGNANNYTLAPGVHRRFRQGGHQTRCPDHSGGDDVRRATACAT